MALHKCNIRVFQTRMTRLIASRKSVYICRKILQPRDELPNRSGARYVGSVVKHVKFEHTPMANEPILGYLKGSQELEDLQEALCTAEQCVEVPIIVGDEEIRTCEVKYQVMPHNHGKKIAKFYYATADIIDQAICTAVEAQKEWDRVPFKERIDIWYKAASLMSKEYRQELNAATMLGQSKTIIQAEIDSACELIDFFRMNAWFLKDALNYQPISLDPKVIKNSLRYRGIDGFIAAVTPFNFTAIGGNLPYTPALMGNAVLWKPSDTAILSNYIIFKICREAGVPPGVVNFVPSDGPVFGDTITKSPHLAGINFTGSVPTFSHLWKQVGMNIAKYRNFPRLVGECGGKNFHFVHCSADVETAVTTTIRSAYEYSGQKCSACARMYVPESLWSSCMKDRMLEECCNLKYGDVTDVTNFMGAVIDAKAFKRIRGWLKYAKNSANTKILVGGTCNDCKGYFVEPTIILVKDPVDKIMREEIFGPVMVVYVYKDNKVDEALELVDRTTPYALTGSVFAQDECWLMEALEKLKNSAGNLYINDKSTGAVVGQQAFGGGRKSGTNDKAGGPGYVLRWGSQQSIKETFTPLNDIIYPYMSKC